MKLDSNAKFKQNVVRTVNEMDARVVHAFFTQLGYCRADRQKYSNKGFMAIRYIKSLHQCYVNTIQCMQHKLIWQELTSQRTKIYSQFL